MNTEQLRTLIENQSLEPNSTYVKEDWIYVHAVITNVTDLIARTLSDEFEKACSAEGWIDYFYKASDYVNKLYRALMALSDECWREYISTVGDTVERSTKLFIRENENYWEVEEYRITHMRDITSDFKDFVYAFFILQYTMK